MKLRSKGIKLLIVSLIATVGLFGCVGEKSPETTPTIEQITPIL